MQVSGADKPRQRAETSKQLAFFPLHAQGFRPAAFVIIPAKVEDATDQQGGNFSVQRPVCRLGLTLGGRQRNDEVTEVNGRAMNGMRSLRLSVGKGEHVRRAVLVTESVVEAPHSPISDERNVHL